MRAYRDDSIGADVVFLTQVTVHESDGYYDTGLVRPDGHPIYRSDKTAIGFDLTPKPRVRVRAISKTIK